MSDDGVTRAAVAAAGGFGGGSASDVAEWERAVGRDPDPRVRVAALGALVRLGAAGSSWHRASTDEEAAVRRRAAEWAPDVDIDAGDGAADPVSLRLVELLGDPDPLVAEAAAAALGERTQAAEEVAPGVVEGLTSAVSHGDPLVREAAVAALGAVGDPAALPVVLGALDDRPPVRRRAVLALAAFEGAEVEEALELARSDRDWQVRQAAEDMLS